jgi:hypothetical protein
LQAALKELPDFASDDIRIEFKASRRFQNDDTRSLGKMFGNVFVDLPAGWQGLAGTQEYDYPWFCCGHDDQEPLSVWTSVHSLRRTPPRNSALNAYDGAFAAHHIADQINRLLGLQAVGDPILARVGRAPSDPDSLFAIGQAVTVGYIARFTRRH